MNNLEANASFPKSVGYAVVEAIVLFVWATGALFFAAPLLLFIISLLTETASIMLAGVWRFSFVVHNFDSPPFLVFGISLTLGSLFTAFFPASYWERRLFVCLFVGPASLILAYLAKDLF